MIMKLSVKNVALLLVGAVTLAATLALAAPRKRAGECGEDHYWHNGKCEDATNRKSEKTWSDEILSRHWKP
jgi:hypothetical protein